MGVLRMGYKGRETKFAYGGIKKQDAAAQMLQHIQHWGNEINDIKNPAVVTNLPVDGFIAEWQDGDVWNPDVPAELLPIPVVQNK